MKIRQQPIVLEMTEKEYNAILFQLRLSLEDAQKSLQYARERIFKIDSENFDKMDRAEKYLALCKIRLSTAEKTLNIFEGKE